MKTTITLFAVLLAVRLFAADIVVGPTAVAYRTNIIETSFDPNVEGSVSVATEGYRSKMPENQKEKWVTTLVRRDETTEFSWEGQTNTITKSTLVSSNTVHLQLTEQWQAAP